MNRLLIAMVAVLPAWGAASAQENRDIRVRIGPGIQFRPEFVGARRIEAEPRRGFDAACTHELGAELYAGPNPHANVAILLSGRSAPGRQDGNHGNQQAIHPSRNRSPPLLVAPAYRSALQQTHCSRYRRLISSSTIRFAASSALNSVVSTRISGCS